MRSGMCCRFVRLEIYPGARRKTVIYHGLARIQVRVKHRGIILGAVAHYTAAVLMSNAVHPTLMLSQ